MDYHIFLAGKDNFEIRVNRGVYGSVHKIESAKAKVVKP